MTPLHLLDVEVMTSVWVNQVMLS